LTANITVEGEGFTLTVALTKVISLTTDTTVKGKEPTLMVLLKKETGKTAKVTTNGNFQTAPGTKVIGLTANLTVKEKGHGKNLTALLYMPYTKAILLMAGSTAKGK